MISQRFKWYCVKLMKKSKLCIRFSQPLDFANGPDLIAQWCNRPAKLPWNPVTKIRTYRDITLEICCFEMGTTMILSKYPYSIYFHHGTWWNLWSAGLSQHGVADRDSETWQILRGRVWDLGIEIWRRWGSYFFIERNTTPLVKGRSRWRTLSISQVYA